MADRSITVRIATSKDGFTLSIVEQEVIVDADDGSTHTEKEICSQDFGIYKSAVEAAEKILGQFEQRMKAADGELFG